MHLRSGKGKLRLATVEGPHRVPAQPRSGIEGRLPGMLRDGMVYEDA